MSDTPAGGATFGLDLDDSKYQEKLLRVERLTQKVQDRIVRIHEAAATKEAAAAQDAGALEAAYAAKYARMIEAENQKLQRNLIREKERAAAASIKLAEKTARAEQKARDKAAADQSKSANSNTFMGRIKGIQQNPFISEAETVASLGTQVGGSISKLSIIATSAIRPIAFLGAALGGVSASAVAATAGLLALPASIVASAIVSNKLAAAAVEATKRLDELGRSGEIDRNARVSLAEYTAATTELGVQTDILTAKFGASLAPTLTTAASTVLLLTDRTKLLDAAFGELGPEANGIADKLMAAAKYARQFGENVQWYQSVLLSGGGVLITDALRDSVEETAKATTKTTIESQKENEELKLKAAEWIRAAESEEEYRKANAKIGAELVRTGEAAKRAQEFMLGGAVVENSGESKAAAADRVRLAEATRRAAEAERELAAAAKATREAMLEENQRALDYLAEQEAGTRRMIDARRDLNREWDAATGLDTQTMIDAFLTKSTADVEAYAGSWKQAGDAIKQVIGMDTSGGTDENGERRKRDPAEEFAAAVTGITDIVGAIGDVFDMQVDRAVEALGRISERQEKLREENADYQKEAKALANAAKKASDANTKAYYEGKAQELENDKEDNEIKLQRLRDREEEERKILVRAFRRSQAASITETVINGAVALVKAVATLGPIAGGIAAAGIAAGTGVAIAKIAAQKPPEYPIGRPPSSSPDHPVNVAIQDEEAILNARGVKAVGGKEGVAAANGGTYGNSEEQVVRLLRVEKMEIVDPNGRGRKKVQPSSGKQKGHR